MHQSFLVATAAGTIFVASLGGVASARPMSVTNASHDYIVVLEDDTAPARVAAQHGRRYGADVRHIFRSALTGYSAHMSTAAAARLAKEPRVQFVQRDGLVHAEKGKPLPASTQTVPTGVNRANADASPTALINGIDAPMNVDVAVIDTGVDFDHPDLNVYTAGAKNCSTATTADDGNGHGTHVAGTIGAIDNGNGVVGMAPGARIWPVRVLNDAGSGTWSNVICGVDYVTAHA